MSMTTRRLGVVFAVVLAVTASIAAASAVGAGADPRQVTVLEPAGEGIENWFNLADTDSGPGGDVGDILLERRPLVDPESAEPVGTAVTRVQVVEVDEGDPAFIIDCTIQLEAGDLVFYGAGLFSQLGTGLSFAVTGGTGDYQRASGIVTVTVGEDGTLIDFDLAKR